MTCSHTPDINSEYCKRCIGSKGETDIDWEIVYFLGIPIGTVNTDSNPNYYTCPAVAFRKGIEEARIKAEEDALDAIRKAGKEYYHKLMKRDD